MIKYEIEGGNLPIVICYPEPYQTLCTEKGAMSWMSSNMEMTTNASGGVGKAFGRLLSKESMFLNEYTPIGKRGMIAFASTFPGSIIPYHVTPGNGIIVQKGGFLAMEKGLDLSLHFQKKFGRGFLSGEGLIMQKITGDGMVFVEIDGHCKEYTLMEGETILIDTGYLAALTESCDLDVQSVKGVKNALFGGEGFFLTRVTGPGKVYLQSMPISNMADTLKPYISPPSISADSSGVNFNLTKPKN